MITLNHQTKAQFLQRFRRRWESASKEQKAKLASWVYQKYVDGDFTGLQIRTAFGLTVEQATAFLNKIQTLKSHYDAIQAEE